MRASGFPTSTRTIQSVLAGFLSALVLLPGQTAPGAGTLQVQDTWQVIELPVKIVSGEGAKKHLPATMGAGIAIADFDGDGRPDLFFANGGELPSAKKTERTHANRLLRNLGDLRFEDVTYEAGLAGTHFAIGAAAGDFDGDGRPDLAVATVKGIELYRNAGEGRFADWTARAGMAQESRWAVGAAWLDYDGDGDQDLFVVNYVIWDPAAERECRVAGRIDFCHPRHYDPQPNTLYRNDGEGRFTNVTQESGLGKFKGKGMGVAVADFDGNSRFDLFVTNDAMPAFLFLNHEDGTFTEAGFEWGVAVPGDGKPVSGMGADSLDWDGDGKPDLIYTALKDETFPFYRGTGLDFDDLGPRTRMATASRRYPGWGIQFVDLDHDGRMDVVAGSSDALSGQVDPSRMGPVVWFRHTEKGTFEAHELPGGRAMHRGLLAVDLNGDGCEEIVTAALDAPAKILYRPGCKAGTNGAIRQWQGSSTVGYASSIWVAPR